MKIDFIEDSRRNPLGKIFAIGDIHGRNEELNVLLDHIKPQVDPGSDFIFFIGDYIDRGPDSKGVVDTLIQLRKDFPLTRFLKGNHEDMMLGFLELGGSYGESFLYNGGDKTLTQYGINVPSKNDDGTFTEPPFDVYVRGMDYPTVEYNVPVDDVRAKIPTDHMNFFKDLASAIVTPNYIFVHAGLHPTTPFEEQNSYSMYWIRDNFLWSITGESFPGKTIVHGHTPTIMYSKKSKNWIHKEIKYDPPEVEFYTKGDPDDILRINIDTGIAYGGRISCIECDHGSERVVAQVEIGGKLITY